MDRTPPNWREIDDDDDAAEPLEADGADARPARDPRERIVLLGAGALGLVIVFAAGLMIAGGQRPQVGIDEEATDVAGPRPARSSAGGTPSAPPSPQIWLIDVEGAVAAPGIYRLPPGSRVADAIAAAGGFGPGVDTRAVTSTINLAQPLEDGLKLVVPERGMPAALPPSAAAPSMPVPGASGPSGVPGSAPSGPVDLNRATQAELEALPGIGPVTAGKIIAARAETPFTSVEELRERKLVGPSTFEKIRELVTIGP